MLNEIGSWSSFLGLIFSFLTFLWALFINNKVKKMKKKVLFNNRVTPLLRDLKKFTNEIKNLYENFIENQNELKVEIAKCRVQLESIIPKIPNSQKNDFKSQIHILKKAENGTIGKQPANNRQNIFKKKVEHTSKDGIWGIYVGLNACINKLDNLIKDKTII